MSILNAFDDKSEAILKPEFLAQPVEGFPEIVLAAFSSKVVEIASNVYGGSEICEMDIGMYVPIYKLSDNDGSSVAIYQAVMGSAGTISQMERVIVMGGKKFIFFGSCGSLDHTLTGGHLVVPTRAYRDEGTSYHYAPASDYIEVETAGKLSDILTQLSIPHICGPTWSTDGFFRETRNNMELHQKNGCISVDMQCSAIMAAAKYRGVEAYQFLYAEDNLDNETWDARIMGNISRTAYGQYLRIAMEIARKI